MKKWIQAMMKCTSIKKVQLGDAILEHEVINVSLGFENDDSKIAKINEAMKKFANQYEEIESWVDKFKWIKIGYSKTCRSQNCEGYVFDCRSCLMAKMIFDMGHAIRRINKETPWNVFHNVTDRVYERGVDIWELGKLAHHKFFNIASMITNGIRLPENAKQHNWVDLIRKMLHTTNVLELNFFLACEMSNDTPRVTFGLVPCNVEGLMKHLKDIFEAIATKEEIDFTKKLMKYSSKSANGSIRKKEDSIMVRQKPFNK